MKRVKMVVEVEVYVDVENNIDMYDVDISELTFESLNGIVVDTCILQVSDIQEKSLDEED